MAAGETQLDSVDRLHDILDNATDRLELTVFRGTEERSVTIEFSESGS